MGMVYVITKTGEGYRWRLMTKDAAVIAMSSTTYATKEECLDTIEMVKGSWAATVRLEVST